MNKPKLALVRPSEKRQNVKPSAPAAAARIERGEARLVVQLPADVHRAVKVKAAERDMSIRDYVLELLRRDGVS